MPGSHNNSARQNGLPSPTALVITRLTWLMFDAWILSYLSETWCSTPLGAHLDRAVASLQGGVSRLYRAIECNFGFPPLTEVKNISGSYVASYFGQFSQSVSSRRRPPTRQTCRSRNNQRNPGIDIPMRF